jgi:hypothetical protein
MFKPLISITPQEHSPAPMFFAQVRGEGTSSALFSFVVFAKSEIGVTALWDSGMRL